MRTETASWQSGVWRSPRLSAGFIATSASGQTLKQVAKFDLPGPGRQSVSTTSRSMRTTTT